MELKRTTCECSCGSQQFFVRLKRDEQVGLLTCSAGHHSLLLDSRDYWADILQDGRPKQIRCKCGGKLFAVMLLYEFRETGDVRSVDVVSACHACGDGQTRALFEIKYSPTEELVSRPLDPIDEPWLQPKRRKITAYWRPSDAEKFTQYLATTLGARIFQRLPGSEITPCEIDSVEFHPELRPTLYFTVLPDLMPPAGREPQEVAPFLKLNWPFHIVIKYPDDIALLHCVEYSNEVVRGGAIVKQPEEFLAFSRRVIEWLSHEFPPTRGLYSADNPEEYTRIFGRSKPNQS
jgi:hypothetical protein